MLISYNWLRQYVDFDFTPEELSEKLDLSGTAVERARKTGSDIQNVVVGVIDEINPHPNAEMLTVCKVSIGSQVLQIVCGASNISEGDFVPVALDGAALPGGKVIKKADIRGIESAGMLCSPAELNLSDDHSGILILEGPLPLGTDIRDVFEFNDNIFELEITPNRPDCLSMMGMAREVAAIAGSSVKYPRAELPESGISASQLARVDIEDGELCPRYTARVITGIKIGPSPAWMQARLKACGLRPINNIVDITNYVLMETGQPLHAFDLDHLEGRTIKVRRAERGERLVTLDGVDRELDENVLVIADERKPVALAGIMGGSQSEVAEATTNILLESANFNPVAIGRGSKALGLRTEASLRFDKRLDPNATLYAANRACQLMSELAAGSVSPGVLDVYPRPVVPWKVGVRPDRVRQLLGIFISNDEIVSVLKRLDIEVEQERGLIWALPPTDRLDLQREVDLIEEIARIAGFEKLASTLPCGRHLQGLYTYDQKIERMIENDLVSSGFQQVITYSFIDGRSFDLLRFPEKSPLRNVVKLTNALSEEMEVMRSTLLPGLVKAIKDNSNFQNEDLKIFETGRVFKPATGLPSEVSMVGMAISGDFDSRGWRAKPRESDFYDMKGVIEKLLLVLGIDNYKFEKFTFPTFHPLASARVIIDDEVAGVMGELHPNIRSEIDLKKRLFLAELRTAALIQASNLKKSYTELPRYPGVYLDVAFIVGEEMESSVLREAIEKFRDPLLEEFEIFDVFSGGKLPKGKKSLAYSFLYRSSDRTLTDEEVAVANSGLLDKLKKELGAEIREK